MTRTEGPTPNGGAYALAMFLDENGREVEQEQAVRVVITEYDEQDRLIFTTHGVIGK